MELLRNHWRLGNQLKAIILNIKETRRRVYASCGGVEDLSTTQSLFVYIQHVYIYIYIYPFEFMWLNMYDECTCIHKDVEAKGQSMVSFF